MHHEKIYRLKYISKRFSKLNVPVLEADFYRGEWRFLTNKIRIVKIAPLSREYRRWVALQSSPTAVCVLDFFC